MEYKTVYELGKNRFAPYYVIPFPFLIICATLFSISIFGDCFSTSWKISLGLFSVSFLLWSLLNLFQMIADEKYIFQPYKANTCEVVEGIVANYNQKSRTHQTESFEVSGLLFVIPTSSSKLGYNKTRDRGSVINQNGENVRITYAYNKMLGNDLVIVKIETEIKKPAE